MSTRNVRVVAWRVLAASLLALIGVPSGARANGFFGVAGEPPAQSLGQPKDFTFEDVVRGWNGFANVWFMVDMAAVLLLAVLLGAVLAYHPRLRSKASNVPELEQPKTFTMYAMVGALIGLVVQVNPVMGFVIFGIGGLLRFRTNVGLAKDTGRVILAVVVGVCCGLKLVVVAIFAAAFGWILTWYLEREDIGRMQVKGLAPEAIQRAAEVYRRVLADAGCRILGEKKTFTKGMVTFVLKSQQPLDREALERRFYESIPSEIRGSVDWEMA